MDSVYNSPLYKDLASIQETREHIKTAKAAQKIFSSFDQEKVDKIIEAMAKAGFENAHKLAVMAVEETGMGIVWDKVQKNQFASKNVYEFIKNMKTRGIIGEDKKNRIYEIADAMGVVAGIIPTTNPTSTIIFKAIIAVKAGNSIVFSPHPRAIKCSCEAARIMEEAAVGAGAPKGLINCITLCTKESSEELMSHRDINVILATGGSLMVKAAYSSGKPAYGVGPGNVPAFIERSANIQKAVKDIILSKSFDNGTICASEQAVITEEITKEQVTQEFERQGGYFVSASEQMLLERTVMQQSGGVNPEVVGQSAKTIAAMAGIRIPDKTKVLIVRLENTGKATPLSAEKLCPVLGFYVERDWLSACERCYELLELGGLGHSLVIHSQNEQVIKEFALKKPVNRILVNTPSSLGAIGLTTGLQPSLTLGCGTRGGNITSDNVGPQHLFNRKRLAYNNSSDNKKPEENMNYIYKSNEIYAAVKEHINSIPKNSNK